MRNRHGYDRLWLWFGLSRASWLTLPRVLMHEMPDEWQNKMAELLEEWDDTWPNTGDAVPCVSLKEGGKFVKIPWALRNYRHPHKETLDQFR